jgi:ligand-binding sensor domain-containing protein
MEKGITHPQDNDPIFFQGSAMDSSGALWLATFGDGVWRYDAQGLTHYVVKDGDKPITLISIAKDNNGVMWLGSHGAGAYKFKGKSFERFRP